MSDFVHLHLHSEFSLLDGATDLEKLVGRAKDLNMPAVAVTDHGNIFGAVHFTNYAKAKGIKPIIGCELYICKKDDHNIERTPPDGDQYNHLVVLAENEEGYRNLVKIVSEASLHGFYYKPRISKAFLAEHSSGLIGTSACLKGEVAESLTRGSYEAAYKAAGYFRELFGADNFFLEIQDQGLPEEHKINPDLFRLSKETGIPLVATNDSHYLCEDDADAHDALLCVQTGKFLSDTDRMKFQTNQFFVKSEEEMLRVFAEAPDVVRRTRAIADRCNMKLGHIGDAFPKFEVPEGYNVDSYFEYIARQGFEWRLEKLKERNAQGMLKHPLSKYDERLSYEIDTIKKMKYPGYFLIVWDFIRYAKERRIPVGPGRGSAAGSLVAYAMRITDIDPMQNDLLFERFLNPERVSMPDIDVDFCMNRRGQVIEYVTQKYGRENVAQIITFGTMAAKAAIKDVGRVMEVPFSEVDRIAKMVPGTPGMTLAKAFEESPQLKTAYEKEPMVRQLIDTARRLEGVARNPGVHAAGVVISPKPLTDLVPLFKTKNDEIVTAYDMKAIEKLGLLKMDFLGLTTLTILDDALKMIEQRHGTLDLTKIPYDDQETYEKVFHQALTSGVFQFESQGMKDVLRRYKPTMLEDLTALNALYRPGPIQGGMIEDFIARKWGRKKIEYELAELEPILKETLGVIVYQEQVMQIASALAGYSLGDADLLRRAMGKKIAEAMAAEKDRFIKGALEAGHDRKKAEHIFDLMAQFAGYGFNKSHSAAYGYIAYQTAYLKTHYPVEFMAALLTSVTSSTDDVVKYINECRAMGIRVEPPDITFSDANFTPHGDAIRFGLAAVKNVGHNAIESILAARKEAGAFHSIYEFCEKVDLRLLNKRVLESLIKAGAMDSLGRRSQLMAVLDRAIERGQKTQEDAEIGQHGLFGVFDDGPKQVSNDKLPDIPDWDQQQRLQNEKEVLGFFVSGHPLEKYGDKLIDLNARTVEELCNMKQGSGKDEFYVGGMISGVKIAKSKKGDLYGQAKIEDMTGSMNLFVFSKDFTRLQERLKLEVPVLVRASVMGEEGSNPKLSATDIIPLDDAKPRLPKAVRIRVPLDTASELTVDALHEIFLEHKGEASVLFDVERDGDFMVVMEAEGYNVQADRKFITRVEELCGPGSVRIID
jgi:DNA polymerase-3 subunit alpha